MAWDCNRFNNFLFRRTPDWDKELAKDRFPWSYLYSNMYPTKTWASFTGDTHTWDRVHVTRPNDDGCWESINVDACNMNICDPETFYTGWGSTRSYYGKFRRDYRSPVFCFDQLRHVEEAEAQLSAIIDGHKEMPDGIISDFIRMLVLRQAGTFHICGSALLELPVTANMFSANCRQIDLGSANNLPTSKLTMNYLDNHVEDLLYNGYFDHDFLPTGQFACTTDIQTLRDMANQNPTLAKMFTGADEAKAASFYEFGIMTRIGNWGFKIDKEPLRFQHLGNGVLERVWPYENVAATVGRRPVFDLAYKNAEYQMFHVFNRSARELYVGDITPVHPEMKFSVARSLMGKWSWKSPDYFRGRNAATGEVCEFDNVKKNKGFFLGEYEMGTKTIYPEIEMIILAKREPQCVVNLPRCAATPDIAYQELTPYNPGCDDTVDTVGAGLEAEEEDRIPDLA